MELPNYISSFFRAKNIPGNFEMRSNVLEKKIYKNFMHRSDWPLTGAYGGVYKGVYGGRGT